MPDRVTFCRDSTISEAWALIQGLPAKIDEIEDGMLEQQARRRFTDVVDKDAVVSVRVSGDLVPPFWKRQLAWDDGRKLARFGHRYLSIHYVRQGEQRYTRYQDVIRPSIETWLEIVRSADLKLAQAPVDRVGFGYVNSFEFPIKGFDLSRHFKLNVGINVGDPAPGVQRLETAFQFFDAQLGTHLVVRVSAESPPPTEEAIRVRTTVFAEKRSVADLTWSDSDRLAQLIASTKDVAKDRFFDFATAETHTLMGAETDGIGS